MNMRIIKLHAENFKYLKAVEIVPDENFQIISGRNEQGKSSVMDSLWAAIEGRAALKDTDKPIRNGEERATITVDLGEIIVTRKFTASGTTLEVKTKDGAKYSSPQKILDDLIGKLSFDPFQFSIMDTKDQVRSLQDLIGFDPSELDNEHSKIFNERTDVNRTIKSLNGQLEGLEKPAADTPNEEESASAILSELQQAQALKQRNLEVRLDYEDAKNNYAGVKNGIELIEERIKELMLDKERKESELEKIKAVGITLKGEVDALVDPDIDSFKTRLDKVEETNTSVRNKKRYLEVANELTLQQNESDKLTAKLNEINTKKQDMLKSAKFPIEGLGFGEDGVEFNDVPLKQCSSSQRIKVAMSVAMAMNPKLRVIRIMDGSLLDSENLKIISDLAKDKDYQVWVEMVDESGEMGVVIEDGQVKEIREGA